MVESNRTNPALRRDGFSGGESGCHLFIYEPSVIAAFRYGSASLWPLPPTHGSPRPSIHPSIQRSGPHHHRRRAGRWGRKDHPTDDPSKARRVHLGRSVVDGPIAGRSLALALVQGIAHAYRADTDPRPARSSRDTAR